jgi:hypothetical protein
MNPRPFDQDRLRAINDNLRALREITTPFVMRKKTDLIFGKLWNGGYQVMPPCDTDA